LKLKFRHKLFTGILVFIISVSIWSVLIEPRWIAERTIDVPLPASGELSGLKVAVASDWHFTKRPLWRVMTVNRAEEIVSRINASHPDIILLPGDFIADHDYKPTTAATAEDEIAAVLGQLKAPMGVYAVLGNHDWWHDGKKFKDALVKNGIQVIENDAIPLKVKGAWIVGLGDDFTGHANAKLAFKSLPKNAPALILMHDPAVFSEFPDDLNAVSFAGHTHGGQVYLPWLGALVVPGRAPNRWAYGWVKHNSNLMYVTSGLGVSILPVRFNMRPEWVMFTIH